MVLLGFLELYYVRSGFIYGNRNVPVNTWQAQCACASKVNISLEAVFEGIRRMERTVVIKGDGFVEIIRINSGGFVPRPRYKKETTLRYRLLNKILYMRVKQAKIEGMGDIWTDFCGKVNKTRDTRGGSSSWNTKGSSPRYARVVNIEEPSDVYIYWMTSAY